MRNLRKKTALLFLFFLSGCISLPKNEQTQNLLAPPSLQPSVQQSLASSFFISGEWPEKQWWNIFNSPELASLIQEALAQNPSLQAIERRLEFAKQNVTVVKSRLFPLLFFNIDETWQYLSHNGLYRALNPSIPINPNLVDLTLSFTYEFDFWGKNRNLFLAALGESKAEEAETAQTALITTTAVAQAFFALKTNLVRRSLYQRLSEVRKNTFQLQVLLQEKALLSKLEPLLSEENVLEAEKLVISIEDEIATNKHLINVLIGRGPDAALEIDASLAPIPDKIALPSELSLDLLSRRPDLVAQIWRVEALAHEVGAAKADFYPNINLTALGGLESTLYSLLFKPSSLTGALQPALHLPIFTAGEIRANLRGKKALFDEAVFNYNNLILKSAQEVSDLLSFAQSVFAQKIKQTHIVQDSLLRYELTQLRQQKGLDNVLDNYDYEEELIEKQLANVSLLYNQYVATIKLIKALGGGYQSEYAIPLEKESRS